MFGAGWRINSLNHSISPEKVAPAKDFFSDWTLSFRTWNFFWSASCAFSEKKSAWIVFFGGKAENKTC